MSGLEYIIFFPILWVQNIKKKVGIVYFFSFLISNRLNNFG